MSIHFQLFIIITFAGQFIAQPIDEDGSTSKNENQVKFSNLTKSYH